MTSIQTLGEKITQDYRTVFFPSKNHTVPKVENYQGMHFKMKKQYTNILQIIVVVVRFISHPSRKQE